MRKIFLALLNILPFFVFSQYVSNPPLIAYDNCEVDPSWQWGGDRTKKWSYWTGADHTLPGSPSSASMTRSSAYARKGNYSYQARVTKNPNFSEAANSHRSEMAFSTPGQSPLGWKWAAVSIYLPSDFCIDQSPMSVAFNTKANPDNYTTPFRLDIRGGRYIAIRANIQTNGTVPNELEADLGPVVKGVWVDWIYHRNFAMDGTGFIEIYKNGIKVFSFNGPNWVTGDGRSPEGYLHTGLYKWPWLDPNGMGWGAPACNNPVEVYYDEYRFGTDAATLQNFLIDQTAPPAVPVAPTVALPISDQVVPINTVSKVIALSGVFADDKGASNLTLSVSGNSNTTVLKTAVISGSNLTLTFAALQSGISNVKIKAADSDGLSIEDEFKVTVEAPLPVAPTVANAIPEQLLAANTSSKSVSLNGVFSDDQPVSALVLSVTGNSNTSLVKTAAISGTNLNLAFNTGVSGSSIIKVKATDAGGLSVEHSFTVTVQQPVNQAPTVTSAVPDQQLTYNTLTKQLALSNVFSDDGTVTNLTLTVESVSNSAVIYSTAILNNQLTLNISSGVTGTSTVTIKATDAGGLSVTDQFIVTLLAQPPAVNLLINSGGSTVNFSGQVWASDKSFNGGNTYSNSSAIAGTTNDAIYQSERYGNHSYQVSVPAGKYKVRLHFAEIFHTATNKRKFNVNVENSQGLLTNYDIVAKAGVKTARVEEFRNVNVTDGVLNISFVSVLDNAKASAIEIVSEVPVIINNAPVVIAKIADLQQSIAVTTQTIPLVTTFSDDQGVSKLAYTVSGNSNATLVAGTIAGAPSLSLNFNGNLAGTSQLKIRATDSAGLYAEDTFNITVVNQAPVANAGADKSITLPGSTTQFTGSGTDVDGTIKSWLWTQVSGPSSVISNGNTATISVSGLISSGTYVYQLSVTDNANTVSTADLVNLVVNPEPPLQVSSFTLINGITGQEIQELANGSVVDLSVTGNNLNIRANTYPFVTGRVEFSLSGAVEFNIVETAAPYSLYGDNAGQFNNETPATGIYNLSATPYSSAIGGTVGKTLAISFSIIAGSGSSNARIATVKKPEIVKLNGSTQGTVQKAVVLPEITTLQAYPNPFSSQVTIGFKAAHAAKLRLEIMNAAGKTIASWPEENVIPDVLYRKIFYAGNHPGGIYFYRITTTKGEVKTGKMILAR